MSESSKEMKTSAENGEKESFAKIAYDLAETLDLMKGFVKNNNKNSNSKSMTMRAENKMSSVKVVRAEYGWGYTVDVHDEDSDHAWKRALEMLIKISASVDHLPGWRETKVDTRDFKSAHQDRIQRDLKKELKKIRERIRYLERDPAKEE